MIANINPDKSALNTSSSICNYHWSTISILSNMQILATKGVILPNIIPLNNACQNRKRVDKLITKIFWNNVNVSCMIKTIKGK